MNRESLKSDDPDMIDSKPTSVSALLNSATSDRDHRRILRGFIAVALFVLIGKSLSAVKEIFVAYRFGTSPNVDSYLYVFNLVQWPVSVLSGVMAAVLIPLVVRARKSSPAELRVFKGECLWVVSLVGLALAAIVVVALPILIASHHSGLTGEARIFGLQIVLPLAIIVPVGILARLMAVWTMAANRHTNTLFESFSALGIIVALCISSSPFALVVGTAIGASVELGALGLGLWLSGELARPLVGMTSPYWRDVGRAFSVMIVGQILMSLVDLIDQFVAAGLETGSIASLGYSNRIVGLILSLAATAIGRAILPVLSETHVRSPESIYRISRTWGLGLFVMGAVFALIVSRFTESIVFVLFERGAFGVADTARVAEILWWSLFKIPGYLSSMVFTYALLSQDKSSIVAFLGGVSVLVKVALAALLVPLMGLNGLVLSTAGVYLTSTLFAMFFLGQRGSAR